MRKKTGKTIKVIVGLVALMILLAGGNPAQAQQFKWKLQSANPAGAPQIVLLKKMAADIEKMSAGRLKIEVLASGAIVKPFQILEGVNKGIIECGQWWTHYSMGKNPAGSLFSSPLGGSGSGLDLMNHLSWYFRGGGRDLYVEYYQKIIKADVMPFLIAPDGPEAFGWSIVQPKTLDDYLKKRYRMSSGLSSDVLKDMGGIPVNMSGAEVIPALERGLLDGGEWINTASDLKLGLSDVAKNYSLQGLHQAIVEGVTTQSILEGMMYFVEQNAKALKILIEEKGVNVFDAPPGYSEAFIKSSKKVLAKFEEKDPFFKKVIESQRDYAKLVVPFTKETNKLMLLISGAAETN